MSDPDQRELGPTLSHPPGPSGPDLSGLLGAVCSEVFVSGPQGLSGFLPLTFSLSVNN